MLTVFLEGSLAYQIFMMFIFLDEKIYLLREVEQRFNNKDDNCSVFYNTVKFEMTEVLISWTLV